METTKFTKLYESLRDFPQKNPPYIDKVNSITVEEVIDNFKIQFIKKIAFNQLGTTLQSWMIKFHIKSDGKWKSFLRGDVHFKYRLDTLDNFVDDLMNISARTRLIGKFWSAWYEWGEDHPHKTEFIKLFELTKDEINQLDEKITKKVKLCISNSPELSVKNLL